MNIRAVEQLIEDAFEHLSASELEALDAELAVLIRACEHRRVDVSAEHATRRLHELLAQTLPDEELDETDMHQTVGHEHALDNVVRLLFVRDRDAR